MSKKLPRKLEEREHLCEPLKRRQKMEMEGKFPGVANTVHGNYFKDHSERALTRVFYEFKGDCKVGSYDVGAHVYFPQFIHEKYSIKLTFGHLHVLHCPFCGENLQEMSGKKGNPLDMCKYA